MNTALESALSEAIAFLEECQCKDAAKWYRECKDELQALDPRSPKAEKILAEIARSLRGMGGFGDLPFEPSTMSQMPGRTHRTDPGRLSIESMMQSEMRVEISEKAVILADL